MYLKGKCLSDIWPRESLSHGQGITGKQVFFFSCFFKIFLACFVLGRKSTLHFTRICEFQGSPVPGNVWAEAGQSLGKETVGTDEQHQYFPTRGKYRVLEGEKQFLHLYEITQKMRNLLFF